MWPPRVPISTAVIDTPLQAFHWRKFVLFEFGLPLSLSMISSFTSVGSQLEADPHPNHGENLFALFVFSSRDETLS
jgi:hypothetical protein